MKTEDRSGLLFVLELDAGEVNKLLEAIWNLDRGEGSMSCLC